jgi:arylsulfatase A-like enzyme
MLYEGGIRVPMIVRWPGRTQPGAACNVPADVADIYPTLMEIAGVDYRDFQADKTTDGKSLVPLFADLKNGQKNYPRDTFRWFYGKMGYSGYHQFATWAVLRKGDFKLHYDYHGKVELYDLATDISERHNLAAVRPQLAGELLDELTGWLQANCNPAYLPQANPDFDPHGPLPYGPYIPREKLKQSLCGDTLKPN